MLTFDYVRMHISFCMAVWVQNHLLLSLAGEGVEEETGNKAVPMPADRGVMF